MAKPNLSRMDFESLVNLRQQVEERLHDLRATIEKQLEHLRALSPRLVVSEEGEEAR